MKDEDDFGGGPPLPIYDNPGHLARRLHQIAVSIFLEETREFGLTPVQYSALTAAEFNPGIDQRALARLIAYDRSTIGDVLQRLEKKGLLRRGDGRDRRSKGVFPTEAGSRLRAEMEAAIRASQKALLSPLSEGEQFIFMYLLQKLVRLNNSLSRAPLRIVEE